MVTRTSLHTSVRIAVAVVAAGALGLSAGTARADDSARIAALEAKIAAMESQQKAQETRVEGAIAEAHAIDAAIADANTKGRFMASDGFTSGWDNGFKLGSADGNFLMMPFVEFQFRNVTNYSDSGSTSGGSDFENGFEIRRLKLGVRGNLFNPDFTYIFRLTTDRSTGSITPDLAFFQYKFADDWAIRFGQFKLNWTHEETMSDTKTLAAERSLMNQIIGGTQTGYVQGVSLLYGSKNLPYRAEFQFTDGDNTANTNYTDQETATGNYQDFGVGVRGEYKIFGDWEAYNDFTARKTDEPLLVVGAGADWAQGGDGNVYRFTVDGQYENPNGLGAYAAIDYTEADGDTTSATLDNAIGALAQVGYLLPNAKDWEIFGRYDITHLDTDVGGESDFHEVSLGVNKYYYGHNAKLTLDAGWYPNGTPVGAGGLGLTNSQDDQFVVRAQFQLVL